MSNTLQIYASGENKKTNVFPRKFIGENIRVQGVGNYYRLSAFTKLNRASIEYISLILVNSYRWVRDPTYLINFSFFLDASRKTKGRRCARRFSKKKPRNYCLFGQLFHEIYLKSVFNTLRATAKFYTVSKRILPATRAQFSTEASRIPGKFDAPTPLPSQA